MGQDSIVSDCGVLTSRHFVRSFTTRLIFTVSPTKSSALFCVKFVAWNASSGVATPERMLPGANCTFTVILPFAGMLSKTTRYPAPKSTFLPSSAVAVNVPSASPEICFIFAERFTRRTASPLTLQLFLISNPSCFCSLVLV